MMEDTKLQNERIKRVKEQADYADDDILWVKQFNELPLNIGVRIDSLCLIYCLEGEVSILSESRTHTLTKNCLLIQPPMHTFQLMSYSDDCQLSNVSLSMRLVREWSFYDRNIWMRILCLKYNPVIRLKDEDMRTKEIYWKLLEQKSTGVKGKYHKVVISSIMQAIYFEIYSYIEGQVTDNNVSWTKQSEFLFQRFVTLLGEHSCNDRTVAYYADKLCITPKYLSTVCRTVSGKTAGEWINMIMTERIRRLLRHSEKSIKEIADELDFPNVSFFGKYVKQHLGASPNQYRNMGQD